MKGQTRKQTGNLRTRMTNQLGKVLAKLTTRGVAGKQHTTPYDQPRASSPINDNYCADRLQGGLLAGSQTSAQGHSINSHVNFHIVTAVPTAPGHSQKRELSPGSPVCHVQTDCKLKYVRGSDPAQSHKVSNSHKLLWQSSQEPLPVRRITSPYRQKRSRVGSKSEISGVFQPTFLGAKTQQVETHPRPEQTKSFPQGAKIQNGDTGNHQNFSPTGRMGHLHRFQGCLLPHTNRGTVQEISKISCRGSDIPVQGPALRSVHSALGVHCGSKVGETDGHAQGYKDPPIPRRLVGEGFIPPDLSPTHSGSSKNMPRTRLAGECKKIGAGAQAGLQFCRLPV